MDDRQIVKFHEEGQDPEKIDGKVELETGTDRRFDEAKKVNRLIDGETLLTRGYHEDDYSSYTHRLARIETLSEEELIGLTLRQVDKLQHVLGRLRSILELAPDHSDMMEKEDRTFYFKHKLAPITAVCADLATDTANGCDFIEERMWKPPKSKEKPI